MFKQVVNPDIYHGWKKEKNFFEGWYFKIVNAKKDRGMAFIPAIIKSSKKDYSHSFIQVLDGKNNKFQLMDIYI